MKRVVPSLLLSLVLVSQLSSQQIQATFQSHNSANTFRKAQTNRQNNPNCADNGTYINSKGQTVKRPESCASAPQGATAQCRDGTYSFSRSRRGTCSHHGGVAKWL
jgi:Protein of unknown function (DUF3761)